jgi:HEAT repeat protein
MEPASTLRRPACRAPLAGAVFLLALCGSLSGPRRAASEPLPDDPVEEFRQALKLEQKAPRDDTEAEKLALKHREENLQRKAKALRTPPDLSRALLLVEWRPPSARAGLERDLSPRKSDYELDAERVEQKVRRELIERFKSGVARVMREGDADDRIAVANLVGETVSTAGGLEEEHLVLYNQLDDLAGDLVRLSASADARVRAAAARALGQFPTRPKTVLPALERVLAPGNPALARWAAARALGNLVRVVSGREGPRRSEPGVMLRETRPVNYKVFSPEQQLAVAERIVAPAARGLRDRDPVVRRACVDALEETVRTLTDQIPRPRVLATLEGEPPPEGRPWSKRERGRVSEARRNYERLKASLAPVLTQFSRGAGALAAASADRDPVVRVSARRVVDELAQVRQLLRDYESSLPRPGREGRKGARATPAPERGAVASLGGPVRRASYEVAVPRAVAVSTPGPARRPGAWLPPASASAPVRLPGPEKKKADTDVDEPLRRVFEATARRLAREGLFDPDVRARRAAAEALEGMGDVLAPYIPELVRALCDRDEIVRWLAARALGELAPRQPRVVLRGLVPRLGDEDLDVRIGAANAIGRYGDAARPAVPALAAFVSRGDVEARVAVLQALEAIGTDASPALPAVARALADEDPRVRAEAARVLGRFGRLAAPYIPALRRLAVDPDPGVRRAGSAAILSITR